MASTQLHCNGSIATYLTENILSLGTKCSHIHQISKHIGVPHVGLNSRALTVFDLH